jgi:hypothetical protein
MIRINPFHAGRPTINFISVPGENGPEFRAQRQIS